MHNHSHRPHNLGRSTANQEEINQFERLADRWWDEKGPFRPLHRLGPVRMGYLIEQIQNHFEILPQNQLKNLSFLDVGCGGGLVCEPLARLGAKVTGLDGGAENIEAAKIHAEAQNLKINYQMSLAENWAKQGERYDVVLALEIIEHVADPTFFVETCFKLLKPGGLIIFSTLNRTPKSYALGIVAAERILHWVPQGTHDWNKFVRPSELSFWLREHGAKVKDICGLIYSPFTQKFSLNKNDIDVNYFLTACRI